MFKHDMRDRWAAVMFRALVATSLWLHVGLIGATTLAVGLLQLSSGEPRWSAGIALVLLGGMLAAMSWRRGLTILERIQTSGIAAGPSGAAASRGARSQAGRGAMAMLSSVPPQSNGKTP